jgi:dTDP-4-amino-4,6-dideoxygalactose transaminase
VGQSSEIDKTQMTQIFLSLPHLDPAHLQHLANQTDARVGTAPFEAALCEITGAKYALATASGTAALHLALVALGISTGDVVLCQSLTFVGGANPILYQNATPIFIDSEPDTWNICPDALETALHQLARQGKRPKAIIATDLFGMPVRWNEILAVADHFGVPVVEDAAEALGSQHRGRHCGTFGRVGVLSFNYNKIITATGGGALISDDKELIDKARHLANQARDPMPFYQHTHLGYNYRMSHLLAEFARLQIPDLPNRVAHRRAIFDRYQQTLGQQRGFDFQPELPDNQSNRWLTALTVNPDEARVSVEKLRLQLLENNIEARPVWKPMHRQPLYAGAAFVGSGVADKLFETGLCLPSGASLTYADQQRVIETMNSYQ